MRRVVPCLALLGLFAIPAAAAESPISSERLARLEQPGLVQQERGSAQDPLTIKTIVLDCAEGKSINQALRNPAEALVIEIAGMCDENVLINRDHVTLRGTDPSTDGIVGEFVADPASQATVVVRSSFLVTLENLTITGDAGMGVLVEGGANFQMRNVDIIDNPLDGIMVNATLYAVADDATIRDNGGFGFVSYAAYSVCNDCVIGGNGDIAALAQYGQLYLRRNAISAPGSVALVAFSGRAYAVDSELSGFFGGYADHGYLSVRDSEVTALRAFASYNNSVIDVGATEFTGSLDGADNGVIGLWSGSVNLDPGPWDHYFTGDSKLALDHASAIKGNVNVREFSQMVVRPGTLVDGDIYCAAAGDTWCANASDVTGACHDCAGCLTP